MKQRVISAAVAILIAIPFVVYGGVLYALGIGILGILGFREVLLLNKSHHDIPFVPSLLAIIAILLIMFTNFNGENFAYGATYMHLIFTSLALMIPTLFYKKVKYTTQDALYLIGIILFLGMGFNSFILARDAGLLMFIYLISIPIITDSAAMIIGSKIGKHKLCPDISPKKSWEGSIWGSILGTIIPILLYVLFFGKLSFNIIIVTLILSVIGQLGDLLFSKIKRENEIKDFSNIMPGHGGILDRLDSMMVVFMSYVFLAYILL